MAPSLHLGPFGGIGAIGGSSGAKHTHQETA
jgi:hypothetical protein